MNEIFEYIKAAPFFKKYAPNVKNYKHKMRGKNRHDNDIDFTDQDKTDILKGIKQLFADIKSIPLPPKKGKK